MMCERCQIRFAAKEAELCAIKKKLHTCLHAREAAPHQICTAVWVMVLPDSRFEVKDSKHV